MSTTSRGWTTSSCQQYIADHHSVAVTGLRSKLIDYYIEATDANGNVSRSAIQHVWIGDGSGSTPGGGGDRVVIAPDPAEAGESLTVTFDANGGPLAAAAQVRIHHGHNDWTGRQFTLTRSMSATGTPGEWEYTYTVPEDASTIEMVFNNGSARRGTTTAARIGASRRPAPSARVAAKRPPRRVLGRWTA
jgi:hypothetical protein